MTSNRVIGRGCSKKKLIDFVEESKSPIQVKCVDHESEVVFDRKLFRIELKVNENDRAGSGNIQTRVWMTPN